MATIRLPVHPLYGERVEVVERYGRHALRVEQPDGQLRLLPVARTDLAPRPAALAVEGRPVRLAPQALRELGASVAARISSRRPPEKVDAVHGDAHKLRPDAAPTEVHHHHEWTWATPRRAPGERRSAWSCAGDPPRSARRTRCRCFVQHLTPLDARRRQVPRAEEHPNGVLRVERAYIAVPAAAAAAATYACVLGLPVPAIQRGAVIKADMAVFDLGPTGLTVAQPAEPGPAAEALARRRPGPFQVLYRTRSMEAAARWLERHGVPPPARGIRNTGERAMLVAPEHACGAYIGFVGPA